MLLRSVINLHNLTDRAARLILLTRIKEIIITAEVGPDPGEVEDQAVPLLVEHLAVV